MSEITEIRVLHIDDDENVLTFSKQFLESFDSRMKVDWQLDPAKGLTQVKENGYDCVVTDYQMPTMDGLELAQRIIDSTSIPVILYTGRGSEEVAEKAFNVGIADYLRKEVDPSHYQILAKRIRNVVEHRQLRNLYQSIAENSMDGVSIKEGTKVLYVNPALIKLAGCDSPEDIVGHDFLEWIPEEDREEMRRTTLLRQQGAELPHYYEYTIRKHDGTKVRCEATSNLISYHGKTVILTEIRDLTERKRMEDRLKRSETRYRHLFDNLINGFAYLKLQADADGNYGESIFLEINPTFEKIVGIERDHVVGKKYADIFSMTPRDRKMFTSIFSPIALKGGEKSYEGYWPTIGKWLRIQVYSSEKGYFSVLMEDVSRQREEREQREAEQKRAVEEVSALLYASRNILRNASFKESAKAIYDSCRSLIGAKTGHISILSNSNAVELNLNESGPFNAALSNPTASKFLKTVLAEGHTILDNEFEKRSQESLPEGHKAIKNMLIAPLKHEGSTIGILTLADKRGGFTERDKRLTSAFAELISIAYTNDRYQAELKTARSELHSAMKEYDTHLHNCTELLNSTECSIIVGQRTRIVYANEAAGRALGIGADELVGRSLSEFRLAGYSDPVTILQSSGGAPAGNAEIIDARGATIRVTLTTSRTTWNGKTAILFYFNV